MKKAHKISAFYDLKDILGYLCDEKQIHTYEYKGYARCLDSTEAYFKYSLEMLDIDISSRVFKSIGQFIQIQRHTSNKIFSKR